MASTNRHAIEISNNTRTQNSKPSGSLLRGNPYNLGVPVLHVNSAGSDPRLADLRRDPPCLVRSGISGQPLGRSSFPFSRAQGRTLRRSSGGVKLERPFRRCPAPHTGPPGRTPWSGAHLGPPSPSRASVPARLLLGGVPPRPLSAGARLLGGGRRSPR